MKKISAFVISCSLVLSMALLAACGNENVVESNVESTNEVVPETSVEVTPDVSAVETVEELPEKELEKVKLEIADWSASKIKLYNEKYCFVNLDDKWYLAYNEDGSIVPNENFKYYDTFGEVNGGWDYVIYGSHDDSISFINANDDGSYTSILVDGTLTLLLVVENNSEYGYISERYENYIKMEGGTKTAWFYLSTFEPIISTSADIYDYISSINSAGVYVMNAKYLQSQVHKDEHWDTGHSNSMVVTITDDYFVKSYTIDGCPVSIMNCSVSKNGWVLACLYRENNGRFAPLTDENGNAKLYYFNIYTEELIDSPVNLSAGCSYVYTADGLTDAIAIGDYVAPCVRIDSEGNYVYKIYNLATESFVDDTEYSRLYLSENAISIGMTLDGKYVYIGKDMKPVSEKFEDCSHFMGDYSHVALDGQLYIIDSEFNIVSDPLEVKDIRSASRFFETSNCLPDGLFMIEDAEGMYHLANVVKED